MYLNSDLIYPIFGRNLHKIWLEFIQNIVIIFDPVEINTKYGRNLLKIRTEFTQILAGIYHNPAWIYQNLAVIYSKSG